MANTVVFRANMVIFELNTWYFSQIRWHFVHMKWYLERIWWYLGGNIEFFFLANTVGFCRDIVEFGANPIVFWTYTVGYGEYNFFLFFTISVFEFCQNYIFFSFDTISVFEFGHNLSF